MKISRKVWAYLFTKEQYEELQKKIDQLVAKGWERSGRPQTDCFGGSEPPVIYSQKLTRTICFKNFFRK